jgi:membrane-bound ClpP family serine protease
MVAFRFADNRGTRLPGSWLGALVVFGIALLPVSSARAQQPAAEQSRFITVGNPITEREFEHVKRLTEDARDRYHKQSDPRKLQRLKIVYDFNPDGQPSASPQFGPCQDLAEYLRTLPDVMTIAYVHKDVSRHTVLPVLACQEIVMAPGDGIRLGNVFPDPGQRAPENVKLFYEDYRVSYYKKVAEQRGRSPALVLKMLDANMQVKKGTRADGSTCYVDSREKDPNVVTVSPEPVLPAGNAGFYTAEQAKRFNLIQATTLDTRRAVKDWYDMPEASLHEDLLEGRTPKAFRVVVHGSFTRPLEEAVKRRLSRAVGQGANLFVLQLDCGGGDPIVAGDLADFLRNLKDNSGQHPVMTVAYITPDTRDHALFLALACNDIVMARNTKLGDYERLLQERPRGPHQPEPPNIEVLGKSLANLAGKRDYPPLLARGMVERDLAIYAVHSKKNPSEKRFLTGEELEQDRRGVPQWEVDAPVKEKGELLVLDAPRAERFGFSRHTVDNLAQLYPFYGLDEAQVRTIGPDWFEEFAAFLRNPAMAVILVMLGITCLILELKMPGVGLPGVVSALCFILFFWAHAQLAFTWLAVLLFLTGLVLIGLEIFVLPGTAVLGISGVVLLLGSLGLATLERWPQTEGEWVDMAGNLGRFGLALVGAVIAAVVAARYLPSIPYANRLVLAPPGEREEIASQSADAPEATSPYSALLGAIGVAATTLRPSGMAQFGDEYVDVVAEGSYVEAGARVQVIEIEGNRIVVKEV